MWTKQAKQVIKMGGKPSRDCRSSWCFWSTLRWPPEPLLQKKSSYQSAHLEHLPCPPRPAASHVPWPSCAWFGSGQEHFPPGWLLGWQPKDSHLPGLGDRAGVLTSDSSRVPPSWGSNNFILMSVRGKSKYLRIAVVWPKKREMCCHTFLDEVFP